MRFELKACSTLEELRAATTPMLHYFGVTPSESYIEGLRRILPPDRMISVRDGEMVVAGAAAYPFEVTAPGARLAAAGLSFVAVLPTHRRRGLLTAMMRAHIEACRERHEAIAYLWASEDAIYQRFGFGLAGLMGDIDVTNPRAQLAPNPPDTAVRIVPLDQAESLVAPIYDAVTKKTPGMFSRSSAWWQTRLLGDPDWRRRGSGELQCAALEVDGRPAAYALYRLNIALERGVNTGTIVVVEAIGRTPKDTVSIWRYLFGIDWFSRVRASCLPLDHPLLLAAVEPRRLGFIIRDGVWIRLVDVGAALSTRSYAAGDPVVFDIADGFCPWNAGRWQIDGSGARRTEAAAEIACDVNAVATAYLGGFSWTRLEAAGRVQLLRAGALERADALFRATPSPWCSEVF